MTNKTKILFRKYLPFFGLFTLTIFLMIFFKVNSNKGAKIFESGKILLADFYIQNLKPIFYESTISRDDVFDFAINNEIPIDKEDNKSLKIGIDDSGEEYFQIIATPSIKSENNYLSFKELLSLNEKQQSSLDSILDSYKEDLYSAVLVNENNTYAINSELNILKKAIAYDLYEFTTSIKPNFIDTPKMRDEQIKLGEFVSDFRNSNNYIVFAQDTILETALVFDRLKLEKDIEKYHFNYDKMRDEKAKKSFEISLAKENNKNLIDSLRQKSFVVRKDKNHNKVIVVSNENIDFEIPEIDLSWLNELTKNLGNLGNIDVDIQNDSLKKQLGFLSDLNKKEQEKISISIKLEEEKLKELIENSVNNVNWQDINEWEEFGLKIDSLANNFEIKIKDSTIKVNIGNSSSKTKSKVK